MVRERETGERASRITGRMDLQRPDQSQLHNIFCVSACIKFHLCNALPELLREYDGQHRKSRYDHDTGKPLDKTLACNGLEFQANGFKISTHLCKPKLRFPGMFALGSCERCPRSSLEDVAARQAMHHIVSSSSPLLT